MRHIGKGRVTDLDSSRRQIPYGAWDVVQLVEWLLGKCEALALIPSTARASCGVYLNNPELRKEREEDQKFTVIPSYIV